MQCVYCGKVFTDSNASFKARPTWEHIINDIRINGPDNIAICCGSCNASKGIKQLEEWLNSKYCIDRGITIDNVAVVVKKQIEKIKPTA